MDIRTGAAAKLFSAQKPSEFTVSVRTEQERAGQDISCWDSTRQWEDTIIHDVAGHTFVHDKTF